MKSLFFEESSSRKLPTLAQFVKESETKTPIEVIVTRIYKPSKFDNFTLECDGKFRVLVYPGTNFYDYLKSAVADDISVGCVFVVQPNYEKPGVYDFGVSDSDKASYEEKPWGWNVTSITALTRKEKTALLKSREESRETQE